MHVIIAQSAAPGMNLLEKIATLELPRQAEFVGLASCLSVLESMLLLAVGVWYLLCGLRMFKMLVVLNAAVIGAMLGAAAGKQLGQNMQVFGAIAGALLLGGLSWPMMKVSVSIMAALIGGVLGFGTWNYIASVSGRPGMDAHAWAGGLLGMITLGLLGFLVFKLIVILFTSFQGSMMAVSGAIGLLTQFDSLRNDIDDKLSYNAHVLPLLIVLTALAGMCLQLAYGKAKKKPAPTG